MKRSYLLFILFMRFVGQIHAQQEKVVEYALSAQYLHIWLFAHDKSIEQFKGVTGTGFQIDLNRYRKDPLAFSYAKVNFNSGFTFQYAPFNNQALGKAFNLAYFIEPFLVDRKNFTLRLKISGGLNLATNPFDSIENPKNNAYSSRINGYLGLGLSAYLPITKNSKLFFQGTYSHFSNGNTHNPNYGMNYPNVGLGIEHHLKTSTKPLGNLLFYPEKWRFDILAFGTNKSLPIARTLRFWSYGFGMQASYRVRQIHAFTFGLEAFQDQSMRYALDKYPKYSYLNLDNRLLGFLVGHEFLFNRCMFTQQLGVYLYKEIPGDYVNRIYHRWGYQYKLNRHVMVGLNLNSNLQKAFIFDARLIYCFYK